MELLIINKSHTFPLDTKAYPPTSVVQFLAFTF